MDRCRGLEGEGASSYSWPYLNPSALKASARDQMKKASRGPKWVPLGQLQAGLRGSLQNRGYVEPSKTPAQAQSRAAGPTRGKQPVLSFLCGQRIWVRLSTSDRPRAHWVGSGALQRPQQGPAPCGRVGSALLVHSVCLGFPGSGKKFPNAKVCCLAVPAKVMGQPAQMGDRESTQAGTQGREGM